MDTEGENRETGNKMATGTSKSLSAEGDKTQTPADSLPRLSEVWHPAVRDWNIIGSVILTLLILLLIVVILKGLLSSFPLNLFFITFIGFLALISGFFFYTGRRLSDFTAGIFPIRREPDEMAEALKKEISDLKGEPEEIDPLTGYTFGFVTHLKTLRLSTGEVIEIDHLHVGSGFALGLYLLVKAGKNSDIWPLLDKHFRM